MFDWQMENDGVKSIDRFGGLAALLKTFGTDPNNVCVSVMEGFLSMRYILSHL